MHVVCGACYCSIKTHSMPIRCWWRAAVFTVPERKVPVDRFSRSRVCPAYSQPDLKISNWSALFSGGPSVKVSALDCPSVWIWVQPKVLVIFLVGLGRHWVYSAAWSYVGVWSKGWTSTQHCFCILIEPYPVLHDEIYHSILFIFIQWSYFKFRMWFCSFTFFSVVNICDSSPCLNGATCYKTTSEEYTCSCTLGWTGKFCESGKLL